MDMTPAATAKDLRLAVHSGTVADDPDVVASYSRDRASSAPVGAAAAVVRAGCVDDVADVIRYAHAHRVPVVPRGAGTGEAGGAAAVDGAIVLALGGMDRIVELDTEDQVAVVEPGVINAELSAAVRSDGLRYAPDPGSHEISTLGGNIATNAGGFRCAKYGPTRDAVLGLEVVTGEGRRLRVGRRALKGVAGYDLTSLFTGSEGTLGVIVGATVRLTPLPAGPEVTTVAFFPSFGAATAAVSATLRRGVVPSVCEIVDEATLASIDEWKGTDYTDAGRALVLLQFDTDAERGQAAVEAALRAAGAGEVLSTSDPAEARMLMDIRRLALPAAERHGQVLVEDVVVPRSKLGAMVAETERIAEHTGVRIFTVGHAADGNLHPTLVYPRGLAQPPAEVEEAAERIFRFALGCGGTLTGEHGIGTVKRRFLREELGTDGLDYHRRVKAVFDPAGIMNPGKVI
jgi:glycolate oxidase